METVSGEQRVWKWVAMVAVVLASGLLGIVLQATRGVLPLEGEDKGHQAIWRCLDEERTRSHELSEEIARLRREFERHLGGRGLGLPAGVGAESK